ncbi:hypothetical protein FSS13T_08690 [Flavobacterium saliperosum S13]|uniref:Uncharacterized protein n=1 Tax=Flavobacterium saliperosum S13 TaxID=1341155 RepID=A0ABN0QI61_9FLAO|nr:hypothetical protein FSS13T_08690 [Flavobacterium saliperosum S13]
MGSLHCGINFLQIYVFSMNVRFFLYLFAFEKQWLPIKQKKCAIH